MGLVSLLAIPNADMLSRAPPSDGLHDRENLPDEHPSMAALAGFLSFSRTEIFTKGKTEVIDSVPKCNIMLVRIAFDTCSVGTEAERVVIV